MGSRRGSIESLPMNASLLSMSGGSMKPLPQGSGREAEYSQENWDRDNSLRMSDSVNSFFKATVPRTLAQKTITRQLQQLQPPSALPAGRTSRRPSLTGSLDGRPSARLPDVDPQRSARATLSSSLPPSPRRSRNLQRYLGRQKLKRLRFLMAKAPYLNETDKAIYVMDVIAKVDQLQLEDFQEVQPKLGLEVMEKIETSAKKNPQKALEEVCF